MGSNPIEDATLREKVADRESKVDRSFAVYGLLSHADFLVAGAARYAIWQSGEAQTFVVCGFDSHPCHSVMCIARTTPF